ncbi:MULTISPECIES: pantetheine-phosphate adenylyltransferase [Glycomyces]|uniref:Phosphopantetheine adenylyltransferase n=2 Tax=Glycomyces TaxID=58113 RepID=A0A9W6LIA1_9ACTN|nr:MULTISPECIES: pantetheine-phosphate adenylyltransferase [Glycomyces]MDA1366485.1 pantetheine-phosphate adenylyltransferase [Glycomyces algeriensis]MDN3239856.1 pantetheine-phosphate adenylyltransferase [Glycomyces tritici]MDR7352143.1 pantetheine-phosphate adenylyltransferase [Glycomyces algeriensis]GLI44877.1 phosphopantetheine adenylyltransferase [Glycomyces algeriensis]
MKPEARIAACSGSFDPVTYGHLDIFGRAAQLYDEVWVAVFHNASKNALFSVEERVELLRETTADIPNVRIASFQGLVVDFCKEHGAGVLVRGVRAASDFDYELQMAQMNYGLRGIETVFIPTNPLYSFLSSSMVKDVVKWGGDISPYVPEFVQSRLIERLRQE